MIKEFNYDLIDYQIKMYKSLIRMNRLSFILNLAVICFNFPIVYYHPSNWLNAICIGVMIGMLSFTYCEYRMNIYDLKLEKERKNRYQEFDAIEREKLNKEYSEIFIRDKNDN